MAWFSFWSAVHNLDVAAMSLGVLLVEVKLQFGPGLSLVKQITSTALVLAVTLVITFLIVWIFNRYSVEVTSRSFLIFFGIFAVSSSIVQFLLDSCISSGVNCNSNLVLRFQILFDKLQLSIRWSRLPVDLIRYAFRVVDFCSKKIVFEQPSVEPGAVAILDFRNGSTVTNLFDWLN